jgi:hypothetical protein
MCLFARAIQTERHSFEAPSVLKEENIKVWEVEAIAHKAEAVLRLRDTPDYVLKLRMDGRLTAGKRQLLDAAGSSVPQHFFENFQRKLAGPCVPLLKAVTAAQVTPISQLDDEAHQRNPL